MAQKAQAGRNPKVLAIVSIVLILAGSFLAQLINTSFYSTKVSRIEFSTPTGVLSGLLYLPKGASAQDPRPTIVTTHGYLNSAEMQDAGAIEMSRRGYVVLALDMYDHGHSKTTTPFGKTPAFFSFWPTSAYDAVQYMYKQPYVLKDAAGNGIISVAGHSMGGFSATMAMVMDEGDAAKTGLRKIHAGLTMGSDYLWASYLKVSSGVAAACFGPRVVGKVAAHYDEFFFDAAAEKAGQTVVYKDYIKTAEGREFLGLAEGAAAAEGSFVTLPNGGKRVIYMPSETHPWNHFSTVTTGDQIRFYAEAFSGYTSARQNNAALPAGSQVWYLKELFECVALAGFFLLLAALVSYLLKVPGLSAARTELKPAIAGPTTGGGKAAFWLLAAFSTLFPAALYPALMNRAGAGMEILRWGSLALAAASIVVGIIAASRRPGERKAAILGAILCAASALALFGLVAGAKLLFPTDRFFNSPTTSSILYWALAVTAVIAFLSLAWYYLANRPRGVKAGQYGLAVGLKSVAASLAVAAIAVAAGYALLYLVDAVFTTDFRIWVWAVKTFPASSAGAALRYLPFFFLYYLAISVSLNANTGRLAGWKGDLAACVLNVGGLVLFLACQYGALFATGRGMFPDQSLNSILLFGLVPSLAVAAIYSRRFFRETGNAWTGAFLNAFLMTMISIANTTVYNGF
jgi:pimeloyl-ACP methyl ester carboxylesterase